MGDIVVKTEEVKFKVKLFDKDKAVDVEKEINDGSMLLNIDTKINNRTVAINYLKNNIINNGNMKATILSDNIVEVHAEAQHFKFPAKAEYEEDFLNGDLQYRLRGLTGSYNGITCPIDECDLEKIIEKKSRPIPEDNVDSSEWKREEWEEIYYIIPLTTSRK